MKFSNHFSFNGAEDDWFFAPVLKHCIDAGKPLAIVEHSLREGEWDLDALLETFPDVEVLRRYEDVESNGSELKLKRLLLKLGGDPCFVLWDRPGMYVLASDGDAARKIMAQLASRFYKPKRHRNKPTFHIVCQEYGETASTAVPVKRAFLRKVEDFELHYGAGFMAFHEHLVARMKRVRQGIAVLRGEPGTGKTTYIRALIWQLRRSHRFYTIPLQEFTRMTASDLTSFWIDEKNSCEKQTIVLVLIRHSNSLHLFYRA